MPTEKIETGKIKEVWKDAVEKVKGGRVCIPLPLVTVLFGCERTVDTITEKIETLGKMLSNTDWISKDKSTIDILSKVFEYSDIMGHITNKDVVNSLRNTLKVAHKESKGEGFSDMEISHVNLQPYKKKEEERICNLIIIIYGVAIIMCEALSPTTVQYQHTMVDMNHKT